MNRVVRKRDRDRGDGLLLKVLTAHYNSLVSARSDESLLLQYSALLRNLRSRPTEFLGIRSGIERRREEPPSLPEIALQALQNMSLDDLQTLVNDERVSRKQLERIAIERFSVPRGSMRSFSNKQSLVDKLRSLIDNERAHQIIGAVARRGATVETSERNREQSTPLGPAQSRE